MSGKNSISRRQFVVGASGLVVAGSVSGAEQAAVPEGTAQLAKDGGQRAVKERPASAARWGEPELKQLESMLQQGLVLLLAGSADPTADRAVSRILPGEVRADLFLGHGRDSHCRGRRGHRSGR